MIKLLKEGEQDALISKKLASLYEDLEICENFKKFAFPDKNPLLKVTDILESYSINRILTLLNKKDEKKTN